MATYIVQPGDSLWEIANDHHLTLKELLAANPQIKNPDLIHPGDPVVVPNRGPTAADLAKLLEPLHQLKAGVASALAAKHNGPQKTTAAAAQSSLASGHGSGTGHSPAGDAAKTHIHKPASALAGIAPGQFGSGHGSGAGKPAPFVGPQAPGIAAGQTGSGSGSAAAAHSIAHPNAAQKHAAAKHDAAKHAAAKKAAIKKTKTATTPPWLTLAFGEYLRWQPWLREHNVAARNAWMRQKILQYGAAGGLSSVDEWCSCFVNWVLQHSLAKPSGKGFVGGTRHALAGSWAAWSGGKQIAPRRGAICVKAGWSDSWCDWKHVGFCLDWSGGDAIEEVTEFDQYSNQYIRAYYNISVEMLGGNQGHPNGYDMGWGYSAVTRSWQTSPHGFLFIWPKWLK